MGIAVQITQQTGVGYGPDGDVSPYETEALLEADKLIRDGLPRSSERLTTARRNEAYYQMQNRRYIESVKPRAISTTCNGQGLLTHDP